MTTFRVEVGELRDERLQRAFKDLIELGRDMTPVWASFGEVLQESHAFRWGVEVGPDMDPWEALSLRTIRRKGHDRILYKEGDLLRGLVTNPAPLQLEFGISDWKAPIHHGGTDDIPARPLVGISPDDAAALLDILEDEIHERWR